METCEERSGKASGMFVLAGEFPHRPTGGASEACFVLGTGLILESFQSTERFHEVNVY